MADVSFLHMDDDTQTNLTLALDSTFYRDFPFHHLPPSDQESTIGIHPHEHLFKDVVSEPESDLFDPVMDFFHQSVDHHSDVMGDADLVESEFGVVEENSDVGMVNLELDLGFGSGFFVEDDGVRVEDADIGAESGIGDLSRLEDEFVNEDDVDSSIPLCWDSLRLDESGEFEWEEVNGGTDERDGFGMLVDFENEGSGSGSGFELGNVLHQEDLELEEQEEAVERVGGLASLEWEVLWNIEEMESNSEEMEEHDGEPYIYTAGYDHLFEQFVEDENDLMGRPPASKTAVESLSNVVITRADVENNAFCAVCKDEICVGETVKQLPCSHSYHGDCIVPWLGIRNTCPVCRHELPTDDADYERRKAQRARRGI